VEFDEDQYDELEIDVEALKINYSIADDGWRRTFRVREVSEEALKLVGEVKLIGWGSKWRRILC
jgi:hypothetical protein